MGQGEKSGMTWNLAWPCLMENTPPSPSASSGYAASRLSRMQVTRFLSPGGVYH